MRRPLETYLDTLKRWFASLYDQGTGRLPPNETLQQGRYIIIKTIGRGGMGAVYLATDNNRSGPNGPLPVAIKELSQARLNEEERREARALFIQEIELLKSLSHPNIPSIYDSFEERGRSYMVMQFIQGDTLEERLKRSHGYTLPVNDVLLYGVQLCDALEYLHQQNIIFRDLKPSNIMVQHNSHIYLIDFGIARYFKPGKQFDTRAFGTPGYMSPEQWAQRQTTPRSDLYNLGVTLQECLTREKSGMLSRPFHFTPARNINWAVPQELETLLVRLLQVDANLRPASAFDVRNELKVIQTLPPVQYPHPPAAPAVPPGQSPIRLAGDASSPVALTVNPFVKRVPAPPTPPPVPLGHVTPFPQPGSPIPNPATPPIFPVVPAINAFQVRVTNIKQQLQTWSWSRDLWEPAFLTLFVLTIIASAVICYEIFRANHSYHLSALLLCSIALLVALVASTDKRIRDPARSILFFIDGGLVLALLALQAFPDAQSSLSALSQALTLNQALIGVLLLGAVIALFRRKERFAWVTHMTIAGLAGLSGLLYFSFGAQAAQPLFSQIPSVSISTIAVGLAIALASLGLISLLRYAAPIERKDAFLLFGIALALGLLQYTYGYGELQQLPSGVPFIEGSFRSLVTLNVGITALPILLAFITLFTPPHRLPAVALVTLVLLFALLQSYLGSFETFPLAVPGFTLKSTHVFAIDTLRQLIIYTLIAGGLLLLLRLRSNYFWPDHFALLAVAAACGALNYMLWSQQSRQMPPNLLHPDTSQVNQQFMIVLGQGAAVFLFLLVTITLLLFALRAALLLFQTMRPYTRIELSADRLQHVTLRLERVIVLVTIIISILMPLAFESLLPTITVWTHKSWMGSQQDMLVLIVLALFLPLLICASSMLARTFAPRQIQPGKAERFAMLMSALLGLLLLWHMPNAPFSTAIQISGNVLHLSLTLLQLLLATAVIFTATLAYHWVKRFSPLHESLLLKANFAVVICCALLSFFAPLFLPLGLLLLLAGSLVVLQMERVS